MRRCVSLTRPLRLVIGSERQDMPGWIRTDIEYLNILRPEDWARYFEPDTIDALLAEHVWEHLTVAEGIAASHLCFRYLRTGGRLRLAVPDGFHPDPTYLDCVRPGGTGSGADDHKVLYTHQTLRSALAAVGFEVELLEYFDAAGVHHARPWDPADGMIQRSARFDPRNAGGRLCYTSLLVDAYKPLASGKPCPNAC
ncbi:conserved hypothetical protein [Opitutus terrae PB90-1]|uniref:Methyltransferase type 11 domain-containing protein n=1 Tax=Opitutus terrae (strain DSM 11246 / JCM 15787 / PB90-1) TaxID=452637 RepID=B1ZVW6_OPITP|nr:conserved hypothetical protein [Opitutus terrae PB90-1]